MDSSRAEVCSGEVPFLEGRRAEGDSFSTCKGGSESVKNVSCVEILQKTLGVP